MFRVCKTNCVKIEHVNFFRVERNLALLLLIATILGLSLANFGGISALDAFKEVDLRTPWVSLTLEGWVYNFGIPAFFALIGLELRRELHSGLFVQRKALVVPAVAAVLGVVVPALLYLAVTGLNSVASSGWPIPTATDVTFALAVYMLFGNTLPRAARVFLLAFAIIDDVIGILIITFLYSGALSVGPALNALLLLLVFMVLGQLLLKNVNAAIRFAIAGAMVLTALIAIYETLAAGLQPTITGVLLGLLVPVAIGTRVEHTLHPWVAGLVLPLFAVMAAGVHISLADAWKEPVFWAILTRPVGKVLGISLGAWLAAKAVGPISGLSNNAVVRVAFLGGIGFTVSLLFCQISFTVEPGIRSAATAATLIAAAISSIAGAIALKTWPAKDAERA